MENNNNSSAKKYEVQENPPGPAGPARKSSDLSTSIFDFGVGSARSLAVHEIVQSQSFVVRQQKLSKKAGLTVLLACLGFVILAFLLRHTVRYTSQQGTKIFN